MSPNLETEKNNRNKAKDRRPPKRKRVITEERRKQNRQAQKNHRKYGVSHFNDYLNAGEKQKHLLQELSSVDAQIGTSQNPGNRQYVPGSSTGIQDALKNGSTDWKDPQGDGELQLVDHVMMHGFEPESVPGVEMSLGILSSELQSNASLDDSIAQKYPSPVSLQDSLNPDSVDLSWLPGHREHPHFTNPPTVPEVHSSTFRIPSIDFQDLSNDSIFQDGPRLSSITSQTFSLSSDEPSPDNINQIIAENRISIEDIIFAGLESITQKFQKSSASMSLQSGPSNNDRSISAQQLQKSTASTSYAPSPSITHLPLRQMALMAACLANAAHIGVDVYEHIRRPNGHCNGNHTISPFFQPALANTPLAPKTIASLYRSTIPDLCPCAAQIKQSHFLYVDTFPLLDFRKRILALRSCVTDSEDDEDGGKKVFDEEEFCRDL